MPLLLLAAPLTLPCAPILAEGVAAGGLTMHVGKANLYVFLSSWTHLRRRNSLCCSPIKPPPPTSKAVAPSPYMCPSPRALRTRPRCHEGVNAPLYLAANSTYHLVVDWSVHGPSVSSVEFQRWWVMNHSSLRLWFLSDREKEDSETAEWSCSAPNRSRLGERFDNRVLSVHRFINRSLVGRLVHYMLMLPGGTATMVAAAQPSPMVRQLSKNTMAVDADALLLKPSPDAAFPAYFLVAVEAGGYVRGLFLLAFYPILRMLSHEACVKAVAMVSFCGLRRDEAARIGRAVLPKLFSREAPHMHAMEALNALPKDVKVVAVSRTFPTVMVEAFLKEYVGFDAVAGRELKGGPRYLTGAMAELDMERLARVPKQAEKTLCSYYPKPVVFHDGRLAFTPTPAAALAMYIYFPLAILLAIVRIAIYVLLPWRVSSVVAGLTGVRVRVIGAVPSAGDRDAEGATKPHGGRLYACNHRTLLDPVGIACALKRPPEPPVGGAISYLYMSNGPCRPATMAHCAGPGRSPPCLAVRSCRATTVPRATASAHGPAHGPIDRAVPSVGTAGFSRGGPWPTRRPGPGRPEPAAAVPCRAMGRAKTPCRGLGRRASDCMANYTPIPLRRLTRNREEDRRRMSSMLARGDVVVCPEGTTCREPYLLRFSPLFAELASEVTPVAVDARTTMFYATSTSPVAKSFDSVYFLMNPRPEYVVQFLEPVNTESGKSSIEVANDVQHALASALGFEGTALTRKDKYLLLAGNEGVVKTKFGGAFCTPPARLNAANRQPIN
ncbi:hypothetical protein HU200_035412 [Digitaria exilis]|uniref:Phospholipid/glycerol acyltransferase domain-containing protein n=1 Tax=Digitaria exilis TaxID=1010633 RepID=A0A835BHJ5_9POAL|nr:hypothetical protein HU200_035412 [Digitaria exilis]